MARTIPSAAERSCAVSHLMLTAYDSQSQYAFFPPDLEEFEALVSDAQSLIDYSVPDNSQSNELSAWNRYWMPFCEVAGCDPERPAWHMLTPQQIKAEQDLMAVALPWVHVRMKGKKQDVANPNSAMQVISCVMRRLNRINGESNRLTKVRHVLNGILTEFVTDYGPILPDQSVPIPTPVLTAMLTLPEGTKLGSRVLCWSDLEMLSFRTSIEVGAQSGVRLDEVTVGRSNKWDKRKMSRASLTWYIAGQREAVPSLLQLQHLTLNDGCYLLPACSKCDRWGTKHGGKAMFFPYRPTHVYNACRALRDLELAHPVPAAARPTTPLLVDNAGDPLKASFVRTMFYHVLRTPGVAALIPAGSPKYTYHSLRKLFCTGLARAGASRERIQSMARWLSPEAVDIYDKLTATDHASLLDNAYSFSPVVYTPALLARMAAIQIDDNSLLAEWSSFCDIDLSPDVTLDWD